MNLQLSPDSAPLKVGDEFLKYEIRALLGHGDHAYVYEAHDTMLNRTVALKLIPDPPNSRRDLVQRSLEQGPLLRDLHHQNLVSVFDVGTIGDELVYIVMERLIGQTLRSALNERHKLTPLELLPIAIQAAEGMAWAHVLQVIHRDLKPENIFLMEGGDVKVLNAGITSFVVPSGMTTERDWVRGTLLYMSPEQLQGFGVTARSDIYSFGSLLYESLAGTAPLLIGVDQLSLDDLALRQIALTPPILNEIVPDVPDTLARLIQQMLAKESVLRFGTMDEIAQRLRDCYNQLLAESGASVESEKEQRPYIVFPSSALGMNPAVPDEGPKEEQVVAGAERLISAAAATDIGDNHETRPVPVRADLRVRPSAHSSKPAVVDRNNHRRALLTAIALGALAGIVFALIKTATTRGDADYKQLSAVSSQLSASSNPLPAATAGNAQLGSPTVPGVASNAPGPGVAVPAAGPTGAEASLSNAKNPNKPDTYGPRNNSIVSSRPLETRPVINPDKSGATERKAKASSSSPDKLVF